MTSAEMLILQLCLAAGLCLVIFGVSHLFGQRGRAQKFKDTPYECGIPSKATPLPPIPLKYYRIILLFLLLDVSLVFLVPWVLSFKEARGATFVFGGLLFLAQGALALFYATRAKFLGWEE